MPTITRALAQIRKLDADISNFRSDICGVTTAGKTDGQDTAAREAIFKVTFQSMEDKVRERNRIKMAIVNSNATNTITVPHYGTITVAAAIELRASNANRKSLLDMYQRSYQKALQQIAQGVESLRKEDKSPELVTLMTPTLCDPVNIAGNLDAMRSSCIEFDSEIDTLLSEHNAVTTVEYS
jgi:hypothetical protein